MDLVHLVDLEFLVDLVDLFLLKDLLFHVHLENLEDLVDLFPREYQLGLLFLFLQQDLSDLFRVSLRDASERVTLEEELDIAHRYLRLEALRLGERLKAEWSIERLPPKRLVPSLILQPLLENAVYHGVEPLPRGGCISIDGEAEGRRVSIRIRNPRASGNVEAHRKGNQIALENIRLRLQLAFGQQAGVALREVDDQFETTLYFPREKMQ